MYLACLAWLLVIGAIIFFIIAATGLKWHVEISPNALTSTFIVNALSSIVAGVVLASLFFILRERIDPLSYIAGEWHCERATETTTQAAYNYRKIRYKVVLLQREDTIQGTIETVLDHSYDRTVFLSGRDRIRGEIEGYLDDNFWLFGKDRLFLHGTENNNGQKATHFYEMCIEPRGVMAGRFRSTMAEQSGKMECRRVTFGSWKEPFNSKHRCFDMAHPLGQR